MKNKNSSPKRKKKKSSKEWTYEVVQADGEVDMEGLAYLLAQMFIKSKYYLNPTDENVSPPSEEKKPEEE